MWISHWIFSTHCCRWNDFYLNEPTQILLRTTKRLFCNGGNAWVASDATSRLVICIPLQGLHGSSTHWFPMFTMLTMLQCYNAHNAHNAYNVTMLTILQCYNVYNLQMFTRLIKPLIFTNFCRIIVHINCAIFSLCVNSFVILFLWLKKVPPNVELLDIQIHVSNGLLFEFTLLNFGFKLIASNASWISVDGRQRGIGASENGRVEQQSMQGTDRNQWRQQSVEASSRFSSNQQRWCSWMETGWTTAGDITLSHFIMRIWRHIQL